MIMKIKTSKIGHIWSETFRILFKANRPWQRSIVCNFPKKKVLRLNCFPGIFGEFFRNTCFIVSLILCKIILEFYWPKFGYTSVEGLQFSKTVKGYKSLTILAEKTPSSMFKWFLNTPLYTLLIWQNRRTVVKRKLLVYLEIQIRYSI